jgi:hypothetical protein
MLVDLPADIPLWVKDDPLYSILSGGHETVRVAEGVYESHFNFGNELEVTGFMRDRYPFSPWLSRRRIPGDGEVVDGENVILEDDESLPADFGVCDEWDQIIEKWPSIITDPRRFIISLTRVRRADQEEQGGWRWHKWGEYIGKQDPHHEYLYDETDIDEVFCFHIHEIV